jgi:hypothetical protein
MEKYFAAIEEKQNMISKNLNKFEADWYPVGPSNIGGRITALDYDPVNNFLYAGAAAGGIFKSTDFGISWIPKTDFLPSLSIGALVVDPVNSNGSNSLVGLRSRIYDGAVVKDSILMGADYYETKEMMNENKQLGRPNIGIGVDSVIESAIVDKNARIGTNVHIRKIDDREETENDHWVAREGLIIIPKGAVIHDNTVI